MGPFTAFLAAFAVLLCARGLAAAAPLASASYHSRSQRYVGLTSGGYPQQLVRFKSQNATDLVSSAFPFPLDATVVSVSWEEGWATLLPSFGNVPDLASFENGVVAFASGPLLTLVSPYSLTPLSCVDFSALNVGPLTALTTGGSALSSLGDPFTALWIGTRFGSVFALRQEILLERLLLQRPPSASSAAACLAAATVVDFVGVLRAPASGLPFSVKALSVGSVATDAAAVARVAASLELIDPRLASAPPSQQQRDSMLKEATIDVTLISSFSSSQSSFLRVLTTPQYSFTVTMMSGATAAVLTVPDFLFQTAATGVTLASDATLLTAGFERNLLPPVPASALAPGAAPFVVDAFPSASPSPSPSAAETPSATITASGTRTALSTVTPSISPSVGSLSSTPSRSFTPSITVTPSKNPQPQYLIDGSAWSGSQGANNLFYKYTLNENILDPPSQLALAQMPSFTTMTAPPNVQAWLYPVPYTYCIFIQETSVPFGGPWLTLHPNSYDPTNGATCPTGTNGYCSPVLQWVKPSSASPLLKLTHMTIDEKAGGGADGLFTSIWADDSLLHGRSFFGGAGVFSSYTIKLPEKLSVLSFRNTPNANCYGDTWAIRVQIYGWTTRRVLRRLADGSEVEEEIVEERRYSIDGTSEDEGGTADSYPLPVYSPAFNVTRAWHDKYEGAGRLRGVNTAKERRRLQAQAASLANPSLTLPRPALPANTTAFSYSVAVAGNETATTMPAAPPQRLLVLTESAQPSGLLIRSRSLDLSQFGNTAVTITSSSVPAVGFLIPLGITSFSSSASSSYPHPRPFYFPSTLPDASASTTTMDATTASSTTTDLLLATGSNLYRVSTTLLDVTASASPHALLPLASGVAPPWPSLVAGLLHPTVKGRLYLADSSGALLLVSDVTALLAGRNAVTVSMLYQNPQQQRTTMPNVISLAFFRSPEAPSLCSTAMPSPSCPDDFLLALDASSSVAANTSSNANNIALVAVRGSLLIVPLKGFQSSGAANEGLPSPALPWRAGFATSGASGLSTRALNSCQPGLAVTSMSLLYGRGPPLLAMGVNAGALLVSDPRDLLCLTNRSAGLTSLHCNGNAPATIPTAAFVNATVIVQARLLSSTDALSSSSGFRLQPIALLSSTPASLVAFDSTGNAVGSWAPSFTTTASVPSSWRLQPLNATPSAIVLTATACALTVTATADKAAVFSTRVSLASNTTVLDSPIMLDVLVRTAALERYRASSNSSAISSTAAADTQAAFVAEAGVFFNLTSRLGTSAGTTVPPLAVSSTYHYAAQSSNSGILTSFGVTAASTSLVALPKQLLAPHEPAFLLGSTAAVLGDAQTAYWPSNAAGSSANGAGGSGALPSILATPSATPSLGFTLSPSSSGTGSPSPAATRSRAVNSFVIPDEIAINLGGGGTSGRGSGGGSGNSGSDSVLFGTVPTEILAAVGATEPDSIATNALAASIEASCRKGIDGFYRREDGLCMACPSSRAGAMWPPLVAVVSLLLGFGVLMGLLMWRARCLCGETFFSCCRRRRDSDDSKPVSVNGSDEAKAPLMGFALRAAAVIVGAALGLQILGQTSRLTPVRNTTDATYSLNAFLLLSLWNGALSVPPSCFQNPVPVPYQPQLSVLIAGILLAFAAMAIMAAGWKHFSPSVNELLAETTEASRRDGKRWLELLVSAAFLLVLPSAASVSTVLFCKGIDTSPVPPSLAAYGCSDQGTGTAVSIAALAFVVTLVFLPATSSAHYVARALPAAFRSGDFRARSWWTRPAALLLAAIYILLQASGRTLPLSTAAIGAVLSFSFAVACLIAQPFKDSPFGAHRQQYSLITEGAEGQSADTDDTIAPNGGGGFIAILQCLSFLLSITTGLASINSYLADRDLQTAVLALQCASMAALCAWIVAKILQPITRGEALGSYEEPELVLAMDSAKGGLASTATWRALSSVLPMKKLGIKPDTRVVAAVVAVDDATGSELHLRSAIGKSHSGIVTLAQKASGQSIVSSPSPSRKSMATTTNRRDSQAVSPSNASSFQVSARPSLATAINAQGSPRVASYLGGDSKGEDTDTKEEDDSGSGDLSRGGGRKSSSGGRRSTSRGLQQKLHSPRLSGLGTSVSTNARTSLGPQGIGTPATNHHRDPLAAVSSSSAERIIGRGSMQRPRVSLFKPVSKAAAAQPPQWSQYQ